MIINSLFEKFESGKIFYLKKSTDNSKILWSDHPAYKGVALKHLIKGEGTDNKFSYHLVKINPGCEIGEHIHEGKIETHEVIDGKGICFLNNKQQEYQCGTISVIPEDIKHKIIAGNEGLLLFAKFIPALL